MKFRATSEFRHTEAYRHFIMENITILKDNVQETRSLTTAETQRYRGDFHGCLSNMVPRIAYDDLWIVSIMNGIEDPTTFDGSTMELDVPTTSIVTILDKQFKTG